jgi:hypothetical protein
VRPSSMGFLSQFTPRQPSASSSAAAAAAEPGKPNHPVKQEGYHRDPRPAFPRGRGRGHGPPRWHHEPTGPVSKIRPLLPRPVEAVPLVGSQAAPAVDVAAMSDAEEEQDDEEEEEANAVVTWPPQFDAEDPFRPLSLPFFSIDSEEPDGNALELAARRKAAASGTKPPKKKKARKWLYEGELDAGDLEKCEHVLEDPSRVFLLQLPSQLPLRPSRDTPKPEQHDDPDFVQGPATVEHATGVINTVNIHETATQVAEQRALGTAEYVEAVTDPSLARFTMQCLDPGQIGTLRVHRSGRVSMVIGEAQYNLSQGLPLRHFQRLALVSNCPPPNWRKVAGPEEVGAEDDDATFVELDAISGKLIATPDLDAMLSGEG